MKREDQFGPQRVSKEFAGHWTAWDREAKRLVGSGHTFAEAKQSAANAGETSVILAKAPEASLFNHARRWTHVVAVFISLVPGISSIAGSGAVPPNVERPPVSEAEHLEDE
jgi:hypothetical protein